MKEFVIEKNVPVPPIKRGGSTRKGVRHATGFTAVLLRMKTGNSVFIKGLKRNAAGSKIAYVKNTSAMKFTYRTVEGGIRIWRVS